MTNLSSQIDILDEVYKLANGVTTKLQEVNRLFCISFLLEAYFCKLVSSLPQFNEAAMAQLESDGFPHYSLSKSIVINGQPRS